MAMNPEAAFVRMEMTTAREPPVTETGLPAWLNQRFFNNVFSIVATMLCVALLIAIGWFLLKFLVIDAVWQGSSRDACLPENAGHLVGACWPFIAARFNQFMYGFYPSEQQWRVNLTYALATALLVPL